jgi:PilZ domain-containing protein
MLIRTLEADENLLLIFLPASIKLPCEKEAGLKEHRKNERIKAVTFATVRETRARALLGFLGNITSKGAMCVGEKPVDMDRDTEFEIDFHGVTEIPGGRLTTAVHVSWCRLDENSGYYHTGFEFLSLPEEIKPAIELLVERYRFHLNIPD